MDAATLFVRALEAEGVRIVFGLPGEENLELLSALSKSSIRFVTTRHEQAAGFMAATYGRLTGRAGVVLTTLGPGATNLVTAAAYAQLGGMPLVMITGQKPIKTSKQAHFQIVDVIGTMKPLTKSARQIVSAASIPSRVREAFRIAEEERPGAVHLELPEDVAREQTDAQPMHGSRPRNGIADERAVARAIDALARAKRPLLMIGAGASRGRTVEALRAFVDRTGIPFFDTQLGKGVVDEMHPHWIGTASISEGDAVHATIEQSDLVLAVGHEVVEKPPFLMRDDARTVIHVGPSPADVDEVWFPQIEVVGDIGNAMFRLAEASGEWDTRFVPPAEPPLDDRFPVRPSRLVREVRAAMPDDGIVCLDNGLYKLEFSRSYRARVQNGLLLDNALATMGAGLPSAMAAKLVHPNRKVLAVAGDGGFLMNGQELETAVRLGLDLVVVVARDDAYGMVKEKQRARFGAEQFGTTFGNPDFVRLAEAYGAKGHRVDDASALAPSLRTALSSGGVHLIEVPFSYEA
ncbi:MAG: acetolactate synthase large subunit [Polyangiales bacterium]